MFRLYVKRSSVVLASENTLECTAGIALNARHGSTGVRTPGLLTRGIGSSFPHTNLRDATTQRGKIKHALVPPWNLCTLLDTITIVSRTRVG